MRANVFLLLLLLRGRFFRLTLTTLTMQSMSCTEEHISIHFVSFFDFVSTSFCFARGALVSPYELSSRPMEGKPDERTRAFLFYSLNDQWIKKKLDSVVCNVFSEEKERI